MDIIILLQEHNAYSIIFRLVLALIIGILIGHGRSKKGSPAGLKTHSLVCIGSTLVMLTSEFCAIKYGLNDITRMAAQVISGIGFLGAGTILVTGKNQIKGLTSAAGIWFSACVGISIGCGFYLGALVASFMEIVIVNLLSKLNISDYNTNNNIVDLYLEYDKSINLGKLIKIIKKNSCDIIHVDNDKFAGFENEVIHYAILTVKLDDPLAIEYLIKQIGDIDGVAQISDI